MAADPPRVGDTMGDVLTLMLVIFGAMSFVVTLLTFVLLLIKATKKK